VFLPLTIGVLALEPILRHTAELPMGIRGANVPPGGRRSPGPALTHTYIRIYDVGIARSATTSDVFNAIGDAGRRRILDALLPGEKPVGAIVEDLSMAQPQVSKHLRVLSEVGLVRCRADGRRRLYRLEPTRLAPFQEWLAKYERAVNDRMDRVDAYLKDLQAKEGDDDT
jgi:DNA-binding transcriptional ArsR family regulator